MARWIVLDESKNTGNLKKSSIISSYEEIQDKYEKMANLTHTLHMSFKDCGYEPRHHRCMIENHVVPVDDVEFYRRIYSVDVLSKFIEGE